MEVGNEASFAEKLLGVPPGRDHHSGLLESQAEINGRELERLVDLREIKLAPGSNCSPTELSRRLLMLNEIGGRRGRPNFRVRVAVHCRTRNRYTNHA